VTREDARILLSYVLNKKRFEKKERVDLSVGKKSMSTAAGNARSTKIMSLKNSKNYKEIPKKDIEFTFEDASSIGLS
jgi:hypothetical protein